MTRLVRILLLAVLLGPQVETILVTHEGVCQEASDCCPANGVCDVNCATCPCCAIRITNFSSIVVLDPAPVVSSAASTAPGSIVLPLFSTEILHVPKSV